MDFKIKPSVHVISALSPPAPPELNVEDSKCYMGFDLFGTLRALISNGLPTLKLGGAGGIHWP